jgi:flagellin
MGLRIQNNIAALNAHRQLTISDKGLSKSLERLSSGYRITRRPMMQPGSPFLRA